MRNLVAIAASVAINLAMIAAFERSADEALPTPNGEVTVTELGFESVPTLAQATAVEPQRAAL